MRAISRSALVAVTAALGMGLITGCGSDDSSTASTGAAGAATTAAAPDGSASGGTGKAAAAAIVAKLSDPDAVEWPKPTTPVDPGKRRVAVITCGTAGAGCLNMAKNVETAAKAIGWKPSPIGDGKFTPSVQAGLVQEAIQQKYDAIALVSIDTSTIKAAVAAAGAKNIPMVCVSCVDSDPKLITEVTDGGDAEGEAIGAYIASTVDDDAKILSFLDANYPIDKHRVAGAEKVIKEHCPGCKYEVVQYPNTDLTKPGPPSWTAALAANPPGSVDFVMSPYDPAGVPMVKTALQQGRKDIRMSGFDGQADFAQLIANKQIAEADISTPQPYMSWAGIDILARKLAKQPLWKTNAMPIVLVTPDNAKDFASGPGYFKPNFDFEAMFKELWGVK